MAFQVFTLMLHNTCSKPLHRFFMFLQVFIQIFHTYFC